MVFAIFENAGLQSLKKVVALGLLAVALFAAGCSNGIARAHGNSCAENGEVRVYSAGGTKQIRALHLKGGPESLALDNKDDLYVGYENACGYKGRVRRYAQEQSKVSLCCRPTQYSRSAESRSTAAMSYLSRIDYAAKSTSLQPSMHRLRGSSHSES